MILRNRIKKIIEAIKDTDINEIEISSFWGAQRIKLTKNPIKQQVIVDDSKNQEEVHNLEINESIQTSESNVKLNDDNANNINIKEVQLDTPADLLIIKAPLVGTFYASPKPDDPPFVNIGDKIEKGDSICIIEAMKIFNDIESEFTGEIVEILVQDNDPVEFDQPLFHIKEI